MRIIVISLTATFTNHDTTGTTYDNISSPGGTIYVDIGCLGGQPIATHVQVVLGDHLWGGPLVA